MSGICFKEFIVQENFYRSIIAKTCFFCSTLYNVVQNKNKNICILSSVPYWKTDPSNHNYKQNIFQKTNKHFFLILDGFVYGYGGHREGYGGDWRNRRGQIF